MSPWIGGGSASFSIKDPCLVSFLISDFQAIPCPSKSKIIKVVYLGPLKFTCIHQPQFVHFAMEIILSGGIILTLFAAEIVIPPLKVSPLETLLLIIPISLKLSYKIL